MGNARNNMDVRDIQFRQFEQDSEKDLKFFVELETMKKHGKLTK